LITVLVDEFERLQTLMKETTADVVEIASGAYRWD